MRLAFEAIDRDKDKLISFADLKAFLLSINRPLEDEDIREMIRDADIDGDDHINEEEFMRLMATR